MLPNLETNYAGIRLKSPIIVSSAGIAEYANQIKKIEHSGAGAVVMKSFFEEEICRKAPTPRFKVLKRGYNGNSSTTLYSYEQASNLGPQEYADEISKAKEIADIPIFASLNCVTSEGWEEMSLLVERAGADGIELNVSCPHGVHIMEGRTLKDEIKKALEATSSVKIPRIVKLSPQTNNPLIEALEVEKMGGNGIIAFNRFTGLDIDLETEKPILHGGYAGHGGSWAIYYNLRWITAMYPSLHIPIAASGGVTDGKDAFKYILAGATVVQICTVILFKGYEVIKSINEELCNLMEEKGYYSPENFRGKVVDKILSFREVDRRKLYVARIEQEKCSQCGICYRSCYSEAIEYKDGRFYISENCLGCGLCAELCPRGAIDLVRGIT
jgi:dihydroorotate dehydrogenase (fumarate)